MKNRYYFLSTFSALLLLFCCSCETNHRVETILSVESPSALSANDKSLSVQQLKSRFSDGTFGEVEVSEVAEGIRVVASLADTSAAALRELEVFFGSVSVGFYDAVSYNDLKVQQWILELSPSFSAFHPAQSRSGHSTNVVLEVPYGEDHEGLRSALMASLPSEGGYALFWDRPKVLERNVKKPVRSLYLYRNDPQTGGPKIGNSEVRKAVTIDTDYGETVIEVEFTEEGRKAFTQMTTEAYADNNRTIGIVVNDQVWSNPSVQGVISGGQSWINGGMKTDPLSRIARQLAWEPLPVKLQVVDQRILQK